MRQYTILARWAATISFVGSLPPGTLNVSVSQYMVQGQANDALWFGAGAVGIEMFMVYLSAVAVQWLPKLQVLLRRFAWISFLVLMVLSFLSFRAALTMQQGSVAVLPTESLPPFVWGAVLSLINPLHLPFWIAATATLQAKVVWSAKQRAYLWYALTAGAGTAMAFVVYALAAKHLVLQGQQYLLHWVVAISLCIAALTILYRTYKPEATRPLQ